MALATFTVGRDVQTVCIAPNGTRLDLSGITDYQWDPEWQSPTSRPLNAPKIERYLPDGHRLRFSLDRNGPANEALVSQIEAGWWSIGSADPGTSNNGSVFVYIQESDGSVTTHQFYGVALKMTKGGDFKTDSPVKMQIEGYAQRFVKA